MTINTDNAIKLDYTATLSLLREDTKAPALLLLEKNDSLIIDYLTRINNCLNFQINCKDIIEDTNNYLLGIETDVTTTEIKRSQAVLKELLSSTNAKKVTDDLQVINSNNFNLHRMKKDCLNFCKYYENDIAYYHEDRKILLEEIEKFNYDLDKKYFYSQLELRKIYLNLESGIYKSNKVTIDTIDINNGLSLKKALSLKSMFNKYSKNPYLLLEKTEDDKLKITVNTDNKHSSIICDVNVSGNKCAIHYDIFFQAINLINDNCIFDLELEDVNENNDYNISYSLLTLHTRLREDNYARSGKMILQGIYTKNMLTESLSPINKDCFITSLTLKNDIINYLKIASKYCIVESTMGYRSSNICVTIDNNDITIHSSDFYTIYKKSVRYDYLQNDKNFKLDITTDIVKQLSSLQKKDKFSQVIFDIYDNNLIIKYNGSELICNQEDIKSFNIDKYHDIINYNNMTDTIVVDQKSFKKIIDTFGSYVSNTNKIKGIRNMITFKVNSEYQSLDISLDNKEGDLSQQVNCQYQSIKDTEFSVDPIKLKSILTNFKHGELVIKQFYMTEDFQGIIVSELYGDNGAFLLAGMRKSEAKKA